MSDTYASLLAIALAMWTAIAYSYDRRLFYAVLPHNAAWIVSSAIVGSGLMNYDPLSVFAWTVITGAVVAFNIGVAMTRGRPDDGGSGARASGPLTSYRVYLLLLAGFSAGFVIYLWTIASNFGLDALVVDPTSIRAISEDGPGYLELFPLYGKVLFYLGPLCFALTVLPDLVDGLRDRSKVFRFAVALYLLVAQAATLQRTNIFVAVGLVLGIVLLRAGSGASAARRVPPLRRLGGLLALAAVGIIAFQGIALALGKTGSDDSVSYSVDPSIRDTPLAGVFHYAASGIPAFSKLVESRDERWPDPSDLGNSYGNFNPQTWGKATFAVPLKLVPGAEPWQEIAPFTEVPTQTNVYTWLEPWYRDFRAPGAVLGALVIGMLVGGAARWAGRSPRILVLGGLLLGFSGLATFVNRYTAVMSLVLYGVIWWAGRSGAARPAVGHDLVATGTGASTGTAMRTGTQNHVPA